MLEVGNKNQKKLNKDRWNHFNHTTMQSLLGGSHRLPLFHMAKSSICLEETKDLIKKFSIRYMINRALNINKAFRK